MDGSVPRRGASCSAPSMLSDLIGSWVGKIAIGALLLAVAGLGIQTWRLDRSQTANATLEADNQAALKSIASLEKKVTDLKDDVAANAKNSADASRKNQALDAQLSEIKEKYKNACPALEDELRAYDDIMRRQGTDNRP